MVVGSIKKLKQETQTNVERQQEKRRSRLAEPIEGRRFHGLHETAEKPLTLKIISLADTTVSAPALDESFFSTLQQKTKFFLGYRQAQPQEKTTISSQTSDN